MLTNCWTHQNKQKNNKKNKKKRDRKKKKKEKQNLKENNQSKTLSEQSTMGLENLNLTLMEAAETYIFEDDFLVAEDDYDFPDLQDNYMEEDNEYVNKTSITQQYQQEELLTIGGYDVKLADIVVSIPKEKTKREKKIVEENTMNYLIKKLNIIPLIILNKCITITRSPVILVI